MNDQAEMTIEELSALSFLMRKAKMGTETWIVHLQNYKDAVCECDADPCECEYSVPCECDGEDWQAYVCSDPVELPLKQANMTALSYETGSMWYICGPVIDPPLPREGAWVRATFEFRAEHYSGPDGEDYDWEFWLDSYELVDDETVGGARKQAKRLKRKERYWIQKAGCDLLELLPNGETACSWRGHYKKPSGETYVPGCHKQPGRICPVNPNWKPDKKADYTLPTNHFLDGTGVCAYAGAGYDPDFEGHQFEPSPEELAVKRPDISIEAIKEALLEQVNDVEKNHFGRFAFWFRYPGDERTSASVSIKANCSTCSGLLQYPDDCPYYTERKLKPSELIVPCTTGEDSAYNQDVAWRFIVLDVVNGPIHHCRTDWHTWTGVKDWGQWWSFSNSYDNTTMWTSFGIPVSGRHRKPMWGDAFNVHEIRKQLKRYSLIREQLTEISKSVEGITYKPSGRWSERTIPQGLEQAWDLISEDTIALLRDATINVRGLGYDWREVLPEWIIRYGEPKKIKWGDGHDYENNLHVLTRFLFRQRLKILTQTTKSWVIEHVTIRQERRLFDQSVIDPWLRYAYGLEGAPDYWVSDHAHHRCNESDDGKGMVMTQDAYDRLCKSWKVRYE